MIPDLIFWLSLLLKMAVTAAFVLTATITAERVGPLIGALVATLPIAAGPAYVFLSLDHDADFIAQSAVSSLAVNAATVIYAVVYARLAQRHGLAVSLGGGFAAWLALALLTRTQTWTLLGASLLNVVVLPVCMIVARPLRERPIPRVRGRWYDMIVRAGMVALLVAAVVGLSFRIGPAGTGVLAVFPIVLTSIMLLLHHRVGGPATAAVLANTVVGLCGFAIALAVLSVFAVPFGTLFALLLALGVSIAWNLAVLGARRIGIEV
jgi:hypothetical protein